MCTGRRNTACVFVLVALLAGCAAVGVPYTSDPYEKLHWASGLVHRGARPFPAQDLIREAHSIFTARGDELGIAAVDRVFASFLASPVLGHPYYEDWFRRHGFWDKSTRWEDRYPGAIAYYMRALAIYERHGRMDWITYVYVNVAETHIAFADFSSACRALSASEQSYGRTTAFGKDIETVADLPGLLSQLRDRAHCA